jgi:hypothetical protein
MADKLLTLYKEENVWINTGVTVCQKLEYMNWQKN